MGKNQLNIAINREKEEALKFIKSIHDPNEYIRPIENDKFDVCLELTWKQHSHPFVDYLYCANIENGIIKGEIVSPKREKKLQHFSLKEIVEFIRITTFGIVFVGLLPFAFSMIITNSVIISFGITVCVLVALVILIALSEDHIKIHKRNIVMALLPLQSEEDN